MRPNDPNWAQMGLNMNLSQSAQTFVKFILVMHASVRHGIYNNFLKHYKNCKSNYKKACQNNKFSWGF